MEKEWIEANAFDEESVRDMILAEITPEQASMRTDEGLGNYNDTIAYKVCNCDLTIEEALIIISLSKINYGDL